MAASNQRDRFFVVHRLTPEGLADIPGGGERIRTAVRPFRVNVDQAHLYGGQGFLEFPVTSVAVVAQPLPLRPPVNVLGGLPDIPASAAKAERLEAHGLQGA